MSNMILLAVPGVELYGLLRKESPKVSSEKSVIFNKLWKIEHIEQKAGIRVDSKRRHRKRIWNPAP